MTIHPFPRPGRFEAVLDANRRQPEPKPDRFTLSGWMDGYALWDGNARIATFHGKDLKLPSRLLRLLIEDAEREASR